MESREEGRESPSEVKVILCCRMHGFDFLQKLYVLASFRLPSLVLSPFFFFAE